MKGEEAGSQMSEVGRKKEPETEDRSMGHVIVRT